MVSSREDVRVILDVILDERELGIKYDKWEKLRLTSQINVADTRQIILSDHAWHKKIKKYNGEIVQEFFILHIVRFLSYIKIIDT